MLFYTKKNIHHWAFWHQRRKIWFYCLAGLGLAVSAFILLLGVEIAIHHYLSLIRTLAIIVLMFASGFVLGWLAWMENEDNYYNWLVQQHEAKKKEQAG
ncbi:hypothetical protein [Microbacter margulisiae]|uniref:Uncharacterized protein n=1 Tax=Microbacter margulisiae TaxID=1350067 RepID=A0A7W5DQW3_9PORP|nr:hypothetical protein [Microbacter margulisiae]MBB3187435.1 hypothetical protein [Microbacter margulisiae]